MGSGPGGTMVPSGSRVSKTVDLCEETLLTGSSCLPIVPVGRSCTSTRVLVFWLRSIAVYEGWCRFFLGGGVCSLGLPSQGVYKQNSRLVLVQNCVKNYFGPKAGPGDKQRENCVTTSSDLIRAWRQATRMIFIRLRVLAPNYDLYSR